MGGEGHSDKHQDSLKQGKDAIMDYLFKIMSILDSKLIIQIHCMNGKEGLYSWTKLYKIIICLDRRFHICNKY